MDDDRPTVRKALVVSEALNERIQEFRFKRRLKTETEAMRTLIVRGLEAEHEAQVA
jgi:hypothetical protein